MITSREEIPPVLERTVRRHMKVVEAINEGIKDQECRATLKHYREEIEALRLVIQWLTVKTD